MATIIKSEKVFVIGKDFADAAIGIRVAHGEFEVNNGPRKTWVSTIPLAQAEQVIRDAAKLESQRVTFFISQAN